MSGDQLIHFNMYGGSTLIHCPLNNKKTKKRNA